MRKLKKKSVAITGAAAALFAAPLIAFAVLYSSDTRNNRFTPGSVDIEVKEGSDHAEELTTKEYTLDSTSHSVDKPLEIKDTRKYPGEVLRVRFVPMWYNSKDEVCDVFDFKTPSMSKANRTLTYTDNESKITLKLDNDWETNGWSYQPDGCFYYTGTLDSSDLTAKLLKSVELNDEAYELTKNYDFRLDVLADAVQESAEAATQRGWDIPD